MSDGSSLTNDEGAGLLVKAAKPIEFNTLTYTPEQLTNALHSYMLPEGRILHCASTCVRWGWEATTPGEQSR